MFDPLHMQHDTKLYLNNFGEEKRRNEKKQNTLSVSSFRRARSENVKVVFSLYRFVRGHRTDYAVEICIGKFVCLEIRNEF
jgi:hypothetical protein